MYKTKTLTELNSIFIDIFERNIELHDSGKLSNDGLIEAMYVLQILELFGGWKKSEFN